MKNICKVILKTLLYIALYFIFNFIVGIIVGIYAVTTKSIDVNNIPLDITLFWGSLVSIIGFLLIFKNNLVPKFKKFNDKKDIKGVLLVSVCTGLIVFGIVNFIPFIIKGPIDGYETLEQLSVPTFKMIISVSLLAPIVEEIMCRGLIFDNARKNTNVIAALIIQAVVFSAIHGNIVQSIYAFFLAIIFALVYMKTETLLAPVIMHIVHNAVNVLAAALIPEALAQNYIVLLIIGVVPIPLLIMILKSMLKPKKIEETI